MCPLPWLRLEATQWPRVLSLVQMVAPLRGVRVMPGTSLQPNNSGMLAVWLSDKGYSYPSRMIEIEPQCGWRGCQRLSLTEQIWKAPPDWLNGECTLWRSEILFNLIFQYTTFCF